jgi:hypothetical protein
MACFFVGLLCSTSVIVWLLNYVRLWVDLFGIIKG